MNIRKANTCTGHRAALYALAPGRTDRHIRSAGGDGWIVEWSLDDPETGTLIASVETRLFSLCTLPDPTKLVAGNMDGGVHWIDLSEPEKTRNIQHHNKGVYDILSSEEQVYTAGGDGVLTLWDACAGKSMESFQLSAHALRTIAFSEKRGELAVGSSDHTIYLLDANTLALKRTLENAHNNSVFSVAYTPDNRYLFSGGRDAMLRVWDTDNDYSLISEQAAHLFTVNHLVFSPDGHLLATASRDKTIRIWNAHSLELLKVIDVLKYGGHINSVNRLLWTPDFLVSCSDDRTMILWEISI